MENALQTSFLDDIPKTIAKRKRKQLEININGSMMELNWLLLPLAPMGRERDVGTILVKWNDSKGNLRGIKISMTDGYNMLTRFDIKVLASLQKLYSEQNKIIPYDFEKQNYIMPIEINYTISEISRALKYKSCGGTITKKIQNSIRKLANCTLTSLYAGGIFDNDKKCYIKTEEKGFHIIEEYDMYRYKSVSQGEKRLKTKDIKDYNKVIINRFFYNNMKQGYFRICSFDILVDLKQDVSQRIFMLLEGWFCDKRPFVYINYETLYERIPLNPVCEDEVPMPIKERNRVIKNACKELMDKNYLQGYLISKSKGVFFIFDEKLKDSKVEDLRSGYYGLDKYSGLKDVVDGYLKAGIKANEIDLYVKNDNIEYCKALLRLYDMNLRYDKFKNSPEGFLRKGLIEGYEVPKKYWNKVQPIVK